MDFTIDRLLLTKNHSTGFIPSGGLISVAKIPVTTKGDNPFVLRRAPANRIEQKRISCCIIRAGV